jgi:hypothetical protein
LEAKEELIWERVFLVEGGRDGYGGRGGIRREREREGVKTGEEVGKRV